MNTSCERDRYSAIAEHRYSHFTNANFRSKCSQESLKLTEYLDEVFSQTLLEPVGRRLFFRPINTRVQREELGLSPARAIVIFELRPRSSIARSFREFPITM